MNTNLDLSQQCLTASVSGDLLSTNVDAFRMETESWLNPGQESSQQWTLFKLDLTSAKMIDSAGLNFVVTLLKRVRARGAKMQIAYSNPNLYRTLMFTRLDQHIELIKE